MLSTLFAAAEAAPAAGAELGQVIGATSVALLLTAALFSLGIRHRAGHSGRFERLAGAAGRATGMPPWAALPILIAGSSLLTAALGLYWDVSLHIDDGRDAGPLANPSHYFILGGLFGIFTAGFLAIVLPRERPGPASVELVRGWHAPVSGLAMIGCASFALAGFPLDDASHRLFGQDVTLWGPTHLMMLGGAAMALIAILALLTEGRAAAPHLRQPVPPFTAGGLLTAKRLRSARVVSACGGLLIALSIFQGEFDFGVPQFNLLFQPLLIALAAGVALVLARTLLGRGGALGAVAFFIAIRGGLTLLVAGGLGESVAHFPLFVVEALLVEAVALRANPRQAPYRFAVAAGALIGTIGVLAEWGWSHVWMPMPGRRTWCPRQSRSRCRSPSPPVCSVPS